MPETAASMDLSHNSSTKVEGGVEQNGWGQRYENSGLFNSATFVDQTTGTPVTFLWELFQVENIPYGNVVGIERILD